MTGELEAALRVVMKLVSPSTALVGDGILELDEAGGRVSGVVGRHWHATALLVAIVCGTSMNDG